MPNAAHFSKLLVGLNSIAATMAQASSIAFSSISLNQRLLPKGGLLEGGFDLMDPVFITSRLRLALSGFGLCGFRFRSAIASCSASSCALSSTSLNHR
jgi:hypothetical protein